MSSQIHYFGQHIEVMPLAAERWFQQASSSMGRYGHHGRPRWRDGVCVKLPRGYVLIATRGRQR